MLFLRLTQEFFDGFVVIESLNSAKRSLRLLCLVCMPFKNCFSSGFASAEVLQVSDEGTCPFLSFELQTKCKLYSDTLELKTFSLSCLFLITSAESKEYFRYRSVSNLPYILGVTQLTSFTGNWSILVTLFPIVLLDCPILDLENEINIISGLNF